MFHLKISIFSIKLLELQDRWRSFWIVWENNQQKGAIHFWIAMDGVDRF